MPNPGPADPPELADVGRLARRLLRKAALLACEDDDSEGPIRVTDAHLDAALDQLLDTATSSPASSSAASTHVRPARCHN